MPSWKQRIICTILGGIPIRGSIRHRPGRETASKAFVRSTTRKKIIKILALHFALLLDLSGAEYHVNCAPVFTESTLAFRHYLIKEIGVKPV